MTHPPAPAARTPHPISLLEEQIVHANPWWTVHFDRVQFPSGAVGNHIRLVPAGGKAGSVVLPWRLEGDVVKVALVELYRYPVRAWVRELPRGFADPTDVDAVATACRELLEETGLVPVAVRSLGVVRPDAGLVDIAVNVVAFQVGPGVGAPSDVDEIDKVAWVSVAELWAMVADGTIDDAFTIVALARAAAAGIVPGPGR